MNQKQRQNREHGWKAMEIAVWKWRERTYPIVGVGVKIRKYEPHQGKRERMRRVAQAPYWQKREWGWM